jgi:hypothetical protein
MMPAIQRTTAPAPAAAAAQDRQVRRRAEWTQRQSEATLQGKEGKHPLHTPRNKYKNNKEE